MEQRLYEAALEGNVIALLELLQEDALVLDRIVASVETPLHIAAMLGHVSFAKDILNRKPEFAGEFNFQRCSPLHLASVKGHIQIVKLLLSLNPSVCLVRDCNGRTPLHLAAMKHQVEILNELARVKPEACWIQDDRKQTILHICITHNNFEAVKLLVNSMLKFLLDCTKIEVNTLNTYSFTALDVLLQSSRDLKDMDRKKHNTIMVVASLIATMTFQTGVNPPGGLWQEDAKKLDSHGNPEHYVGTSIMSTENSFQYDRFLVFNTVVYVTTIFTNPTNFDIYANNVAVTICISLMGLLLLANTIRLVVRSLRKFGRFIKRMIWPSNSKINRNCNNV
ncbi:hypothetical protein NE237_024831 [Protea cynaroides]|uniref:PGG domain-containing protein n=1 Tax=Protea cynaroides TaxID=273540 RepID=A0A9Q0H1W4_9MAGN|nr:hypothetical protein NE237_024831 [Protea cynaroides]